ncbi:MAG: RHS repeat-associated core domain-containing protein [Planctomycetes bacterium]|nr:RHS repeat-associated core domain-containing protein [Planctomycetota bacterium]
MTKSDAAARYYATRIVYNDTGVPWMLLEENYTLVDGQPADVVRTRALELRNRGAERYLFRLRDPETLAVTATPEWRDAYEMEYSASASGTSKLRYRSTGDGEERPNGTAAYDHHDAFGNVRFTTNQAGAVSSYAVYTAFGELVTGTARRFGFCGSNATVELLFPAQPFGSGLIAMGHRLYDPSIGRFLQVDPSGLAGGLNLFVYAGGRVPYMSDLTPDLMPGPVSPTRLQRRRRRTPAQGRSELEEQDPERIKNARANRDAKMKKLREVRRVP